MRPRLSASASTVRALGIERRPREKLVHQRPEALSPGPKEVAALDLRDAYLRSPRNRGLFVSTSLVTVATA